MKLIITNLYKKSKFSFQITSLAALTGIIGYIFYGFFLKGSKTSFKLSEEITSIPEIKNTNLNLKFPWAYLVDTSLSGSIYSTKATYLFLIVNLLVVMTLIYMFRREFMSKKDLIILVTINIISHSWIFVHIRDLPDEAYVWASKIVNFSETGRLGVELFDGTYGESTVGTLQFICSALFFKFTGLSIEQSIILPITISFLLILNFTFLTLKSVWQSYFPPLLFVFSLLLSSKLLLNVVNAFDNVMALLLILIWIAGEKKIITFLKLDQIRFLIIILGPLIRMDLLILSGLVFVIWISEINNKKDFMKNVRLIFGISVVYLLWLVYKIWAFQDVIPAMAKHKAPTLYSDFVLQGFKYTVVSIGKFSSILIAFSLFGLGIAGYKYFSQLRKFHLSLVFFLVYQIFNSIFSGGDYFGTSLARYILPSIIALFYIVMIEIYVFTRKKISKPIRLLSFLLILSLILALNNNWILNHSQLFVYPFKNNEIGRVTCDNLAINSARKYLEVEGRKSFVIATAEVNNAAYYLDASLIDTMGLVDSRLYPMEPNPYSPGNTLRKFRVIPENKVLSKADLIWFYGSAACQDFDPFGFLKIGKSKTDEEKFVMLLNSTQVRYRYEVANLFKLGFTPLHLDFDYVLQDKRVRNGEVFILVNSKKS
jgi:hypothetical protein